MTQSEFHKLKEPANLMSNRANVEWVSVSQVLPNPLNPRRNDAIKTEEMQNIIKKRGFEEPLTVYKRGNNFVVLAGHRRLFAAKEAKCKAIPVFIVDTPKTHQEEIERIASLQSGRVQWSAWEWSRFTFERWIAWGRPALNPFAKEIALPKKAVESYITVMDYFPSEEIEAGVNTGIYSVRGLYDMVKWVQEVKKTFPNLVADLSEELIRRNLLNKLEKKKVTSDLLRKRGYLDRISEPLMKEFFVNPKMTLEELMIKADYDVTERTFHGRMVSVGLARTNVKNLNVKSPIEAKKAFDNLIELQESIKSQLEAIERKFPDTVKKDNQLEW